ncbi:MAG: copper homeostasis protein CutC [Cellulosilyticaceae bacterium]
MNQFTLEICVDSVASAIMAANNGATRLELCSNLVIGGTTPTSSLLELVRDAVDLPIHVLIRPRFGDFLYSHWEFEQIKRDILMAKKHLADGVVIGMCDSLGRLDKDRLTELVTLARPMHVTLHRVFDVCTDPFEALEDAIAVGCDTILTSGQCGDAVSGMSLLRELREKSAGRITIMPGAGVKPSNLETLAKGTGATAFHMSAKRELDSAMVFRNDRVYMGLPGISEFTIFETDGEQVAEGVRILQNL